MPEWIGKTIGKVRIDKYLARGGMAEVYLGTHLTLDRPVAIKVLHSYIEDSPDLLARFQREAKVVAAMRHPNIVQIFDFDTIDGHPYIIMEYLKGPTLSTYLRGLHDRGDRIPSHQVARLLKGLAEALDYAHGLGIIHRDIKPGNMLLHGKADEIPLDRSLTNDVEAILTDFGLVRLTNVASQTASGMVSGTPNYMSPEQARGDKTDHRTDIYSLGVVLYEMLAGRVPFEGESTLTVIYKQINDMPPPVPGVSTRIQTVMNRALAKSPDDRYQTCREMAIDYFLAVGMTAEAETITASMHERTETVEDRTEPPVVMAVENQAVQNASIQNQSVQNPSIQNPSIQNPSIQNPVTPTKRSGRSAIWIGGAVAAVICLIVGIVGGLSFVSRFNTPQVPTTAVQNTEVPTSVVTQAPTAVVSGPPDGTNMIKIDAGNYEVGSADLVDDYHVTTQHIDLKEFWIDKYQVTNLQYQDFMQKTNTPQPVTWPVDDGKFPVRGVTWEQAQAYCSSLSKRLPAEAEWEAAGRGAGTNPQIFPWGNDPTADGKALDLPDTEPYEVGSEAFNVSPFGVYDLVGNVWEWVDKPYVPVQDGLHVLRGGRFGDTEDLAYRVVAKSDAPVYLQFAGFRCAADQVK